MQTNLLAVSLRDWHDLFTMGGGAAATLLGLLFVALSLNADVIFASQKPQLKYIAEQAFRNYMAALMLSFMMISPFESSQPFGQTLMIGVSATAGFTIYRLIAVWRQGKLEMGQLQVKQRILPAAITYAILWFCGAEIIGLFPAVLPALPAIAISMLILLIAATETAWELLVRVAQSKHATA